MKQILLAILIALLFTSCLRDDDWLLHDITLEIDDSITVDGHPSNGFVVLGISEDELRPIAFIIDTYIDGVNCNNGEDCDARWGELESGKYWINIKDVDRPITITTYSTTSHYTIFGL